MLSNLPPWKTRSNIRRFTLAVRRETRASFSRQKSRNRRPPKPTKWLIKNCAANPAENDDLVTRKFSLRRSPTVRWIFLNVVEKQSESGALVLGHWVKGEIGDP